MPKIQETAGSDECGRYMTTSWNNLFRSMRKVQLSDRRGRIKTEGLNSCRKVFSPFEFLHQTGLHARWANRLFL
jgi:hypothetical protein